VARNPFSSEGEMFKLLGVVIGGAVLVVLGAWINTWVGVAVAVIAVAGIVWWVMQEPTPGAAEAAPKLDSATPAGVHRVLVVAAPGTSSVQVPDEVTDVVVVVPALSSTTEALTGAVDDRRHDAEATAAALESQLAGARVEVGADDPALAVEDALRVFGADEVLVVGDDGMLESIRERVALPVSRA
jgi:hypothetical protein